MEMTEQINYSCNVYE